VTAVEWLAFGACIGAGSLVYLMTRHGFRARPAR
jgi:hypothetical protein